ncbi:hypothetical protein HALDL1_12780 [Halobacterium sp. DL1]|jgi:hypothetical protein|nr:hypothetical protein HALDL1_12780 [Halobacterium sp. DL1]
MFAPNADTTAARDLTAASRRLRHAVHDSNGDARLFDSLAALEERVLDRLGDDQLAAKAFWLNVHGALAEQSRDGPTNDSCLVAGTRIDADHVAHKLLRAGRWKYGFGYLPDPLPGQFARRHSLDELDPRVHFAVLAARRAPRLVPSFRAESVDDDLGGVTARYLDATVVYDDGSDVARVPRVFLWYRGDFGGPDGVRELLAEHEVLPEDAKPRLSYVAPTPSAGGDDERRKAPEEPQ